MTRIGTPHSARATRAMLLGAGELGKEVAIELARYGVEVIAVDRYANAPAMQVAHRCHVIDMLDGAALRAVIEREAPHHVIPEIEAIATAELIALEGEGVNVTPTARAAALTMDREGIRRLAAETLGVPTSAYRFAKDFGAFREALEAVGLPVVVKPVMSSSGKGQSVVVRADDAERAWEHARAGARGRSGAVIVEGFIDFEYEITLLTLRHAGGTSYCAPIGHRQVGGDYRESWQPQAMSETALARCRDIAGAVTDALGGHGIFGVEFFVKGETVWFSEVSPRPHDTGLVTLIGQNLSEFALHARAVLGLPVPVIRQPRPAASAVIVVEGDSDDLVYDGLDAALAAPDTEIRLFGKPEVRGERRMGVALALGETVDEAREKARRAAGAVKASAGDAPEV